MSDTVLANPSSSTPASQPKKHSLLPILTVLFVISYSLFLMLVIEQGNIITSQRWLIRQLLSDSTQLSAMKGKAAQQRNAEAQTQAEAKSKSKTQTRIPSIQVPQEQSKASSRIQRMPQHPPKPASDSADVRRSLISI